MKQNKKQVKKQNGKVKVYPMPKDFFGEVNDEVKIKRQISKTGSVGGVRIG